MSAYDTKCTISNCCGLPLVPHDPLGRVGGHCMVCERAHPENGGKWPSAHLIGVNEVMRSSGWVLGKHISYCDSKECETIARRTLAHILARVMLPFEYTQGWDAKKANDVVNLVCTPETLLFTGGWKRFSASKQQVQEQWCINGFRESNTSPGQCLIEMVKANNHDNGLDVPLDQVAKYNLEAMRALGKIGEIEFPPHFPEPRKASYRAMLDQWNALVKK